MFLTSPTLPQYLLTRGHVTEADLVDGPFVVSEVGRRNRNFRVRVGTDGGFFVKQVSDVQPQSMWTLYREARCYQMARSSPQYAPLAELMPPFTAYDDRRHVLVLGLLNGENLTEYHSRLGTFPEPASRLLGETLGAYHSDLGQSFGNRASTDVFPRQMPWILNASSMDLSAGNGAGGNQQVLQIVQQFPDFEAHLREIREVWTFDHLMHGDIKWDNCIRSEEGETVTMHIVDWELADLGHPAWDVGSVLQNYLQYWITSMPMQDSPDPSAFVHRAAHSIDDMQPAIRAFWDGYREARGVPNDAAPDLLALCVRCAAARMVQTAFEYAYNSPRLDNAVVALLQVSLNVLKNPLDAVEDLFALDRAGV